MALVKRDLLFLGHDLSFSDRVEPDGSTRAEEPYKGRTLRNG